MIESNPIAKGTNRRQMRPKDRRQKNLNAEIHLHSGCSKNLKTRMSLCAVLLLPNSDTNIDYKRIWTGAFVWIQFPREDQRSLWFPCPPPLPLRPSVPLSPPISLSCPFPHLILVSLAPSYLPSDLKTLGGG